MVIETRNLTKKYRIFEKEAGLKNSLRSLFIRKYTHKTALSDFNLTVNEGEFIGLIGPNGAGKTTLIKMLTGIIAPSSGEISVLGHYPNNLEDTLKKQYAVVMGQKSQLFFELTAGDTLLLFKELYGIPDKVYRYNLDYFAELFHIRPLLNVQVRTLSLGERMKMELVTALLHNPRVLFLDEPTIGLDAPAQRQIRAFLKEVNETKGTTILLTSHYMDDIKSLCRRCVVINHGEKIYDGDTESLFAKYRAYKKVTLTFIQDTEFTLPQGCKLIENSPQKSVFMAPVGSAQLVVSSLMSHYMLHDITIEEDDIGDVVERIYSEKQVATR